MAVAPYSSFGILLLIVSVSSSGAWPDRAPLRAAWLPAYGCRQSTSMGKSQQTGKNRHGNFVILCAYGRRLSCKQVGFPLFLCLSSFAYPYGYVKILWDESEKTRFHRIKW
jgi:hypothetical protein